MNSISLGKQDYSEALKLQKDLRAKRISNLIPDTLMTVEHPRVITRGRRPADQDFLIPPEQLLKSGFSIVEANRGGRLTYHGPGQLVGYYIFSLRELHLSIPDFVRRVEESVIRALQGFQVRAGRREGCPGVWVGGRKIASIGLSIDRGVSMHGVAINVDPAMEDFQAIVPCGIPDCAMTSLKLETGISHPLRKVEADFQEAVATLFHPRI